MDPANLFVIIGLILVNGFFALAEMAVVSARKPLLKLLVKKGEKRAEAALALAENPARFQSTVQVVMTLIGLFAGAYGGATIAQSLTPAMNSIPIIFPYGEIAAVTLVVIGITYVAVVIAELVPRKFAVVYAERITLFVVGPMQALTTLFHPFVFIFDVSANLLSRAVGVLAPKPHMVSEEELQAFISEGAESGAIEKTEHEMLQRVIRLDDRDVKSIMTHRTEVVFIDLSETMDNIRTKIKEAGHSRYPVIDGNPDELRGVVLAKDMLERALSSAGEIDIRSHIKDIMILPESASCLQALESFKKNHINLIAIVDEYGSTQGIVTSADILEAIVGVLPSNYDEEDSALILQREDGSWLVDGRTPIEEVHLTLGLHEISAEEDFDTLAGYVLGNIRSTPKEGVFFEAHGYRFEIVDMDERRIDKILMTKLLEEKPE